MSFSLLPSRKAMAILALALGIAGPALGQEVVLKGINSQLNISGKLLSSAGGKFVVKTAIGEFEIEQSLVTCEGDGCPQIREIDFDLNIVGEGDIAEILLPIIAEGYASTLDAETILLDVDGNPLDAETAEANLGSVGKIGIQIVDYEGEELAKFGIVEAEGTAAYELFASGEASILFVDERANKKQRDFVAQAGGGDLTSIEQDHVIAVEGYAVVVNPKNTVGAISLDQVADIMAGRITDWSELGGAAGQINVYSLDSESEASHTIYEMVLEDKGYTLTPEVNIMRNTRELTAAMMRDEGGFGLVNFSSRRETRTLPVSNECEMTFYVSSFSIKTEEYPLSHRIHAYIRPELEGHAAAFRDYIDGPDLDGLVSKAGFVDLSVVADMQLDAAERVAAAARAATDPYEKGFMETLMQKQGEFERLSTTFRFAPGSGDLDTKGARDLARLIAYLAERNPGEVMVVGFTDGKGTFDANMLVGEKRAAETLEKILAAAGGALEGIAFSSRGYGELSPVACNGSARGRATNRRVEIWIR